MEEKFQNKKLLIILPVLLLVVAVIGVTYAFFNYTRTGASNSVSTGSIYFLSEQTGSISVSNFFPTDSASATHGNNSSQMTIAITAGTSYEYGIDYSLTAVNVTRPSGSTTNIPVKIVTSTSDSAIGYTPEAVATITDTSNVLLGRGHIDAATSGGLTGHRVTGTITVTAYIDAQTVAITDTATRDGNTVTGESAEWVNGRTIVTTEEWNRLAETPITFAVKVVADEGAAPAYPLATTVIKSVQGLETTPYGKVYSGSNTAVNSNYVWFNNEQWRILGVYTDAVTGQENLKIIKATPSTTSQVYNSDTSSVSPWSGSTMQQTYLYGNYTTLISDATSRGMIEESATWNVGACAADVATVAAYDCANDTTWTGKIGLIGSYEYLYAAENDGACWTTSGSGYYSACYQKDWLYNTITNSVSVTAWTLSPYNTGYGASLRVGSSGNVYPEGVNSLTSASPVVYLKSTITITGGNGGIGETDSYKLG